jgi:hypothetical protein
MGKFRYFVSPAKEQVNFGYPYDPATMDAPFYSEIEISDFILEDSFTSIDESLDDPKHLGGIFSYANFQMDVDNFTGKFAIGASPLIFPYKIKGSKIRIEWDDAAKNPICGDARTICGDVYLIQSRKVFEGIIFDEPMQKDSDLQILQFQVLGYLSLLDELGNFSFQTADKNSHSVIFQIFLPLVERGIIKEEANLPTLSNNLSDYVNFARDNNQPNVIVVTPPIDNDKNLKDLLNDMISIAGGYIYFIDDTYYFRKIVFDPIRPNFQLEAFNQNAQEGIENIMDLKIKPEFDRVFSKIVWTNEQPYGVTDPDWHEISAADPNLFGIKPFEIDFFEYVTTIAEADKVMNYYAGEFSDLKKGFRITLPLSFDAMEPYFLESVKVIIPPKATKTFASSDINDGEIFPTIVFGRKIDMRKETIEFYLRWAANWP